MLTAEQIRELFQMRPHPIEGGFFAETYRGAAVVPRSLLPGYPGDRAISTAIYYLLTPDTFSAMHRVRGDEMFLLFGRCGGNAAIESRRNRRSDRVGSGYRGGDALAAHGPR